MTLALVVPSCRGDQITEFLHAWREQVDEAGVAVYVVEDGPVRSFALPAAARHLCWADAPHGMLECIEVRSPACRQIGIFHAFADGVDAIVTLDDDVRPADGPNAFRVFADVLGSGVPLWVDPLLNYRSRGYPETNVGTVPVAFHVASFLDVPDVDGETQIRHGEAFADDPPRYVPRPTVVAPGQLIPVNGGASGWDASLTPFVHYTVWDSSLGYRRFEDIWMGVIVKRLLDRCGLAMTYGPPELRHVRASDAVLNARLEVEAKKYNELFWQRLDEALAAGPGSSWCTLDAAWEQIARAMRTLDNPWARREGECMLRWSGLFARQ